MTQPHTQAVSQLDLFEHVLDAYREAGDRSIKNAELYGTVARRAGLGAAQVREQITAGGKPYNRFKRTVRWTQQTLKHLGLLERAPSGRGVWQLTERTADGLSRPPPGVHLLAFSTDLGIAVWGDSLSAFPSLGQPIHLAVTSPPYLLRRARAYGNPHTVHEYIDFICAALEPVVRELAPGGSVCLNVTNDSFEPASAARSTYQERLVLALVDRLGLHKMDTLIWCNPSKPPGPIQYASKRRVQLNTGYEPVYWFTNDPELVFSDNRRVLKPHQERHARWLDTVQSLGRCPREAVYGDGAYRLRAGSYANRTPGTIPKNVLTIGHACQDTRTYRNDAKRLGLPVHGAMMPLALPRFLIEFLTKPGQLVVDWFGGTAKTGMAAEALGRHWIVRELYAEYLRGGAERFRNRPGFLLNPEFAAGFPT